MHLNIEVILLLLENALTKLVKHLPNSISWQPNEFVEIKRNI